MPEAPESPCCGADVKELCDKTEFWRVTHIEDGEPIANEYLGVTDESDFRGYQCTACDNDLEFQDGKFVEQV